MGSAVHIGCGTSLCLATSPSLYADCEDVSTLPEQTGRIEGAGLGPVAIRSYGVRMADFPDLPPELQQRLTAAGVVDGPSMLAAFAVNPQLQHDYEQYFYAHRTAILDATLAQILAAFPSISHKLELAALWAMVPSDAEERFISAVEENVATAEAAGETKLAENIRKRLGAVKSLRAARLEAGERLTDWLDRLEAADEAGFVAVWNEIPIDLEETFVVAVAERVRIAEAQGDMARAERLGGFVAAMRDVLEVTRSFADQPPVNRALLRFLQAEADAQAQHVFVQLRELLDTDQAQYLLDEEVNSDSVEGRQRIAERRVLLRALRQEDARA
jgi:hypothetical protein